MYNIFQYIKLRLDILICLLLSFILLQCVGDKLANTDHTRNIDETTIIEAQIVYIQDAMREGRLGVKERQGKQRSTIAKSKKDINDNLAKYGKQMNENIKSLGEKISSKTFSVNKISELRRDLAKLDTDVIRLLGEGKSCENAVNELEFSVRKHNISGNTLDKRKDALINDYKKTSEKCAELLVEIDEYKKIIKKSEKLPSGMEKELDSIKSDIKKFDLDLENKIKADFVTLNTLQKQGVLKEVELLKETTNKETLNQITLLRDQIDCAMENLKKIGMAPKKKLEKIKQCDLAIAKLLEIEKAVIADGSNAACVIIEFDKDSKNRITGVKGIAAEIFNLNCNDSDENTKKSKDDKVNFNDFRDEFFEKTKLEKNGGSYLLGFKDFNEAKNKKNLKKLWLGHKSIADRYGKDKPDSVYNKDYSSFAKNNRVQTKVVNHKNVKSGKNIQYITIA